MYQTTSNKSFIEVSKKLEELGVENHNFFLKLYDDHLIGVDTFSDELTGEQMQRIIAECKINYWYFLREIARVETTFDKNVVHPFKLNRGILAINFCLLNNINVYAEMHDNIVDEAVEMFLLWQFIFRDETSNSNIVCRDDLLNRASLSRIEHYKNVLPAYISKVISVSLQQSRIKNLHTNSAISIKDTPKTDHDTRQFMISNISGLFWCKEFAYNMYNDQIHDSVLLTKRCDDVQHTSIFSSVPGRPDTQHGGYAKAFVNSCAIFNEYFYDVAITHVKEHVAINSLNNFIHIKFNYEQLGKDIKYFGKEIKRFNADWGTIKREVLLEWQ